MVKLEASENALVYRVYAGHHHGDDRLNSMRRLSGLPRYCLKNLLFENLAVFHDKGNRF
jgi:hypothetical protein